MKTLLSLALVAGMLTAATGHRKVTQNKLSPPADTSMKLDGQSITIEYNAPSARNRKVEGGLIPNDQVWRLGADSATTLTTDVNITIGDLRVPKGVYTLYLLAKDSDWKLIVNKQTGQWGTEYNESQDLGRTAMKVTRLSTPVETLKITLKPAGGSQGTLEIEWGNSHGSVPVKLS
jgi:hypothetical protein